MNFRLIFLILHLVQCFHQVATKSSKFEIPDENFCPYLTTPLVATESQKQMYKGVRTLPICMWPEPGSDSWPYVVRNMHGSLEKVLKLYQANAFDQIRGFATLTYYSVTYSGEDLHRTLFIGFDFSGLNVACSLYIQAIKGPEGVPFGDFIVDSDAFFQGTQSTSDIKFEFPSDKKSATNFIQPCTFTPEGADITLPVFIWDAEHKSAKKLKNKFGLIFRYDELSECDVVTFFQFLIIYGYKWDNQLQYYSSTSEVLYPQGAWVPDINTRTIKYPSAGTRIGKQLDFRAHFAHSYKMKRIIPNLNFELCIQTGAGFKYGYCSLGPDHWICDADDLDRQKSYEDWAKSYSRFNPKRPMCPTHRTTSPPSNTETTAPPPTSRTSATTVTSTDDTLLVLPELPLEPTEPPPPLTAVDNLTTALEETAGKVEKAKQITHGDLCIYVWFVLLPPVNYLARYFKDSTRTVFLSLGLGVIVHVAAHHLGIILIWISFGLVLASPGGFFGDVGPIHFVVGVLATLGQIALIFHSMWPRAEKDFALMDPPVHHISYGHFTWFLTLICTYYANRITHAKMIMVTALAGVSILAYLVGTLIEKRIDKYLNVFPPRRFFPELERITIDGPTPYTWIKRIWFLIYLAVLYGLYLWLAMHHGLFVAA